MTDQNAEDIVGKTVSLVLKLVPVDSVTVYREKEIADCDYSIVIRFDDYRKGMKLTLLNSDVEFALFDIPMAMKEAFERGIIEEVNKEIEKKFKKGE